MQVLTIFSAAGVGAKPHKLFSVFSASNTVGIDEVALSSVGTLVGYLLFGWLLPYIVYNLNHEACKSLPNSDEAVQLVLNVLP